MVPMPIGLVPPWRSEASESEHLLQFTLNDERDKLVYSNFNTETNDFFIIIVQFLCKQTWPDLQTAVAFSTTCIKSSDVDNNKKLCRTMR